MNHSRLLTFVLFFGACLANKDIYIDGINVTDASITEINSIIPGTPANSSIPTSTPIPATSTSKPTTIKPNPPPSPSPSPPSPAPEPSTTPTAKTSTAAPTTTTTTAPTVPTTTKPETSTSAPIVSTVSPPNRRKFDGPSFFGGIILAFGMVAIGFVAFKFYKARNELNYHTL